MRTTTTGAGNTAAEVAGLISGQDADALSLVTSSTRSPLINVVLVQALSKVVDPLPFWVRGL